MIYKNLEQDLGEKQRQTLRQSFSLFIKLIFFNYFFTKKRFFIEICTLIINFFFDDSYQETTDRGNMV